MTMATPALDDLGSYWDMLAPGSSEPAPAPSVSGTGLSLRGWVEGLVDDDARFVATVCGSKRQREELFAGACFAPNTRILAFDSSDHGGWVKHGVLSDVRDRFFRSDFQGTISSLVYSPFFTVEEPLRALLDEGRSLATNFFQAIWEARHDVQEEVDAQPMVTALTRWLINCIPNETDRALLARAHITQDIPSPQVRMDMFLLLAALGRQNRVFDRGIIRIKRVEQILDATMPPKTRARTVQELASFILQVERWGRLGSGFGVLLDFGKKDDATMGLLRQHAPTLFKKVQLSLV